MNRRNFLKSIATVCGAAVVCPGELVKSPVKPTVYIGKRVKLPWKHYYTTYCFKSTKRDRKLLKKFREAIKNTKFHPPIHI